MGLLPTDFFCSSRRILEETERVEGQLTKAKFLALQASGLGQTKQAHFRTCWILSSRYAVSRVSTPIPFVIAKAQSFRRITEKLGNCKAVVKLFRILRTGCNAHPNRALLTVRYSINVTVVSLWRNGGAALVRVLAKRDETALALKASFKVGIDTPKSTIASKKRVSAPGSTTLALCTVAFRH